MILKQKACFFALSLSFCSFSNYSTHLSYYYCCFVFSCFFFLFFWVVRCREKQRKESARLQTVNRKLSAMNKLLMEENDRLQKQVSHLVYENGFMKHRINTVSLFESLPENAIAMTCLKCEFVFKNSM